MRRAPRTCPSRYKYPISNYVSPPHLSPSYRAFANHLSFVSIPYKLQDALNDPKLKVSIVEEMKALKKNCSWELVKLLKGKKAVGCNWVFTVKHRAYSSIER